MNNLGLLKLTKDHIQQLSESVADNSSKSEDISSEKSVSTLKDLLDAGIVEYVDVNEENNCLIALQESDVTKGWVYYFILR